MSLERDITVSMYETYVHVCVIAWGRGGGRRVLVLYSDNPIFPPKH